MTMGPIVELIREGDRIVFTGDEVALGWIYNNSTLDAWYRMAEAVIESSPRPNAPGAYDPGTVYSDEHRPAINGQYYASSQVDALQARNRLAGFHNGGNSVTMRVTDALGTTEREVWVVEVYAPFHYDLTHFTFDVALYAPDPRRYGGRVERETGMPVASTGLKWDLGVQSPLYLDWGTVPVLGRVLFRNDGPTSTYPAFEVGGAGAFTAGFRVTEVETGRELTFSRATTTTGEIIRLDSRTNRATIAGVDGDATRYLTSREWFEIPPGATRTYQINPIGGTTGSPTMTLYAASAYL